MRLSIYPNTPSSSNDLRPFPPTPPPSTARLDCIHRTAEERREQCRSCGGRVQVKVFGCGIHGQCTLDKSIAGIQTCSQCTDRQLKTIKIGVGVITAPRMLPTLAHTIDSLRRAGFEGDIHIFAEPDSPISDVPSTVVTFNESRLGPIGNWLRAVEQMSHVQDSTHVLICEDDVGFVANTAKALNDGLLTIPDEELGYLSLYTPLCNWELSGAKGNGWRRLDLGRHSMGALAYCLPVSVVHKLISIKDQLVKSEGGHTDLAISSALRDMGLGTWFHNPSWAYHTGATSTIGHDSSSRQTAIGIATKNDSGRGRLAVITARYNPANYELPRRNYRRFAESLAVQGASLYTVDVAFGDSPHEIPAGLHVLHVRSNSILWQKERALNEIVSRLPNDIDKIAWIDADILFEDTNWLERAIELLKKVPLVQLFDRAHILNKNGEVTDTRRSVAYTAAYGLPETRNFGIAHPGFAWAARRDLLAEHGLYDANIVGGGDSAMTCGAFGWFDHPSFDLLSDMLRKQCLEWTRRFFEDVRGRVAYLPAAVRHLWHGERRHRRYVERTRYLKEYLFDPSRDLRKNDDGCWEWASDKPQLHRLVSDYFKERMEDGPNASESIGRGSAVDAIR